MVSVDLLKHYLLIPNEVTEDDYMIQMMIDTATVYVKNAANYFDYYYDGGDYENSDFIHQADLAIILRASELYQNRNLYAINNGNGIEPTYVTTSLMIQLNTYPDPTKEDTNE